MLIVHGFRDSFNGSARSSGGRSSNTTIAASLLTNSSATTRGAYDSCSWHRGRPRTFVLLRSNAISSTRTISLLIQQVCVGVSVPRRWHRRWSWGEVTMCGIQRHWFRRHCWDHRFSPLRSSKTSLAVLQVLFDLHERNYSSLNKSLALNVSSTLHQI